MLLRIEKYPHRMNFSKGILESRKLHYKHLSKLLVCILYQYHDSILIGTEADSVEHANGAGSHPTAVNQSHSVRCKPLHGRGNVSDRGQWEGYTIYWRYSRYESSTLASTSLLSC